MKTVLFSPIAFSLAETTRALTIARAISGDFHCHFASYGGDFETLIEQEGFPLTRLEPRLTLQIIRRLYELDQGRSLGAPYDLNFVRRMVRSESALYKRLQPAVVVTGINVSTCISCPTAQIPLVWLIQSGMAMNTAARHGRLKDIDALDGIPIRWLPDGVRIKLSEWLLDVFFAWRPGRLTRWRANMGWRLSARRKMCSGRVTTC